MELGDVLSQGRSEELHGVLEGVSEAPGGGDDDDDPGDGYEDRGGFFYGGFGHDVLLVPRVSGLLLRVGGCVCL